MCYDGSGDFMLDAALDILKKLNSLGYESYIIGGYPRNLLLKKSVNDIDICTSATPDIIKEHYQVIQDYSRFGAVKIEYQSYIFEITTFRIELEYQNRYPKIEFTDCFLEDLKRRDFTINTICIDQNDQIVDLLNARLDLDHRMIRCVGDIDKKLLEDPIRILRAIRFSTELGFTIEPVLLSKMIEHKDSLKTLNYHSVEKELSKMNSEGLNLLNKFEMEELLCKKKY